MTLSIKDETHAKLNDPELIEIRRRRMAQFRAIYDGEYPPSDEPFVISHAPVGGLECINGRSDCLIYSDPAAWLSQRLDALAEKADLIRDEKVFLPPTVEFWLYGVHFTDRILGVETYELGGEKGNWQVRYADWEVGELQMPDLESNETWQQAKRLAELFLEADVSLPFFAMPVIGGPWNQCMNLYGQRLCETVLLDPEAVRHDLDVMSDLLCAIHGWYRENMPSEQVRPILAGGTRNQPDGFGQICGCATHLISTKQYADVVAPYEDKVMSLYPNGSMIHICGKHTQHIPTWREMQSVRVLQLDEPAAQDLETYFNEMREDQIFFVFPWPSVPLKRIMDITGGKRVVIQLYDWAFDAFRSGEL